MSQSFATTASYTSLTDSQLETAIYWVAFYAERARWAGFSRVAGRGRTALRDLKAELEERTAECFLDAYLAVTPSPIGSRGTMNDTTTQLRENHFELLAIDDWFGDYVQDYDVEAIRWDLMNLINERLPEGFTLFLTGEVIANVDALDVEVDWGSLTTEDDLIALADKHARA